MTLDELNDNIKLHEQLERLYDLSQSLRDKTDLQAPKLDGMPHATDVSDKVGNLAIAIMDLDARIQFVEDRVYENDERIRAFANSFEDVRVQVAIQLRYISGFTWDTTALLMGDDCTADAIRRLVCRALARTDTPENGSCDTPSGRAEGR